jgi:RNA polymerase sigma factor (sigma-70 family)
VDQLGDPSFDAAFDGLRRLAYRVAFRLLGSRSDAEDIAAETLARACARWGSVANHADPWVVTTATHLVFDLLRRRRTADSHRHQLLELTPPPTDVMVERRLDLRRVLDELPTRQREVVAMRFLADWSEQDTARAMNIDVGTVKSQTSRALARLRQLMAPPAGVQPSTTAAPTEGGGQHA